MGQHRDQKNTTGARVGNKGDRHGGRNPGSLTMKVRVLWRGASRDGWIEMTEVFTKVVSLVDEKTGTWLKSIKCENALFLEPKITSSLCDAVGSEDEKQTRTLNNGKDRHHN